MEVDLAAECVKRIEATGEIRIGTLVMDDDSTTIFRIRCQLNRNIEKWSDIMHVKKHLKSTLYKAKLMLFLFLIAKIRGMHKH